jgi:hypothetical protein
MADDKPAGDKSQPHHRVYGEAEKLEFIGMDEVPSLYADSFMVGSTNETATLYFFQNSTPPLRRETLEGTVTRDATTAKCFARIVVAPTGFVRLLQAMAENAGFVLSKREEEPRQ